MYDACSNVCSDVRRVIVSGTLTLVMFPILVTMYVKLARREEREVLSEFGDEYSRYAARTPAFLPRARRMMDKPA